MPDASTTRYTRSMSRSDDLCNSDALLNLELMHLNTHYFIDPSKTGIIYQDSLEKYQTLAYSIFKTKKYFGLKQEKNLSRKNRNFNIKGELVS